MIGEIEFAGINNPSPCLSPKRPSS